MFYSKRPCYPWRWPQGEIAVQNPPFVGASLGVIVMVSHNHENNRRRERRSPTGGII